MARVHTQVDHLVALRPKELFSVRAKILEAGYLVFDHQIELVPARTFGRERQLEHQAAAYSKEDVEHHVQTTERLEQVEKQCVRRRANHVGRYGRVEVPSPQTQRVRVDRTHHKILVRSLIHSYGFVAEQGLNAR